MNLQMNVAAAPAAVFGAYCCQCGMPHEYERCTAGAGVTDGLCGYCSDPANYATPAVDNAGLLDLLLQVYREGEAGDVLPAQRQALAALVDSLPRRQSAEGFDALVLYSGGKDSSYMLLKLVERGLRVCAWMLDSGYQSAIAIDNASRLCARLGVPLVIERPQRASMDTLFRIGFEVGKGDANVALTRAVMTYGSSCMPCFAAIAAAATRYCAQHDIPLCFIGTQQGQNRLDLQGAPALSGQRLPRLDQLARQFVAPLKQQVERARPEAARLLDHGVCDTALVPFYEFHQKPSPRQQSAILQKAGWEMPKNTGTCSSNCMMNELGRKVMRTRFGFDLYQVIEAHERRLGHGAAAPAPAALEPALDLDAVCRGARLIGLSAAEMSLYQIGRSNVHVPY